MSLIFLKFKKNSKIAHGGIKRTHQVLNLIQNENNLDLQFMYMKRRVSFWPFVKFVFFIIKNKMSFVFCRWISLKSTYKIFIKYYLSFKNYKELNNKNNLKLRFITDIVHDEGLVILMISKFLGYESVAYPHNLESLVPGQTSYFSGRKSPDWFGEEVSVLKMIDSVYVISREELWILRCLGLNNVKYLPFSYEIEPSLINNKIKPDGRKYLVLFGSAVNLPTEYGMNEFLGYFEGKPLKFEVCVAGLGTDRFKDKYSNPQFNILGALDNNELQDLLLKSQGVIIHQVPTSGALTKIADLLNLNIPIYCNFNAARDNWNLDQITYYDELEFFNSIILDRID